jgi:DNA-binding MarR family transcriptional regulator
MSSPDLGRIMRQVALLSRYWEGILDAGLRDSGITSRQLLFLGVIERDFPAPPAISEVADAMVTSHQNVMQMARTLERRGFVRVEADARDRRVRRIVLTDEHRAFWSRRGDLDAGSVDALFAVLSGEERLALQNALDRLLPHTEELYRRRHAED